MPQYATNSSSSGSVTVVQPTASDLNAQVVGNVAHDAVDSGNPVKIGLKAYDPASMPADVAASDRVNATGDLKGRQFVYLSTTLDSSNDSISTKPVTVLNANTVVLATNLVVKASAGRLLAFEGINTGPAQYIQVHDAAALPADTTVPEIVIPIAAGAAFSFNTSTAPLSCTAGIVLSRSSTVAIKTIGAGAGDLWISARYE